jgi:hypothetical protein
MIPPFMATTSKPLTKDDVVQIVREELSKGENNG